MATIQEISKTELGKKFLAINDRVNSLEMPTKTNEIGKREVIRWNEYSHVSKSPYAITIAEAFDKMVEATIPQETILSTKFQNWINRERNELMVDTRINKDDYFKNNINFDTGETRKNYKNELIQAKIDLLNKELAKIQKAFTTHMEKNPQEAFANNEELTLWQAYYSEQSAKVLERIGKKDYTAYTKKDKEGNITKEGKQEDAEKHLTNIGSQLEIVKAMREQQGMSENTQEVRNEETEKTRKMYRM